MDVFLYKNPTSALHCICNTFPAGIAMSFSFIWTQVCASSSVAAMKFTNEAIFWWSVKLNIFANIFFNICVSLFIFISLMALNSSIGYSVSPEVTRYGTFGVVEFVSSLTWTFKLVHPRNGICVPLTHCTLKLSSFSNIFFNVFTVSSG